MGSLSVLDAARRLDPMPRVVFVSSADVYGRAGHHDVINESTPVLPDSPYAGSKAAAERLVSQHVTGYGLPVLTVRPFNHIGPGQSDAFLVSALARRIATGRARRQRRAARREPVGRAGLPDVRDVVGAYRLLVEHGVPGRIYNVCSGIPRSVQSVADALVAAARRPLRLEIDPALLRPRRCPRLIGSAERLRTETGWTPRHDVTETLVEFSNGGERSSSAGPGRPSRSPPDDPARGAGATDGARDVERPTRPLTGQRGRIGRRMP